MVQVSGAITINKFNRGEGVVRALEAVLIVANLVVIKFVALEVLDLRQTSNLSPHNQPANKEHPRLLAILVATASRRVFQATNSRCISVLVVA
jgi:hypothetical protein